MVIYGKYGEAACYFQVSEFLSLSVEIQKTSLSSGYNSHWDYSVLHV